MGAATGRHSMTADAELRSRLCQTTLCIAIVIGLPSVYGIRNHIEIWL